MLAVGMVVMVDVVFQNPGIVKIYRYLINTRRSMLARRISTVDGDLEIGIE